MSSPHGKRASTTRRRRLCCSGRGTRCRIACWCTSPPPTSSRLGATRRRRRRFTMPCSASTKISARLTRLLRIRTARKTSNTRIRPWTTRRCSYPSSTCDACGGCRAGMRQERLSCACARRRESAGRPSSPRRCWSGATIRTTRWPGTSSSSASSRSSPSRRMWRSMPIFSSVATTWPTRGFSSNARRRRRGRRPRLPRDSAERTRMVKPRRRRSSGTCSSPLSTRTGPWRP